MLGQAQLNWLLDALTASKAPFKMIVIGGQVISSAPVAENYIRHFEKERNSLLSRIEKEKIKGVIFLNGDRHFTDLWGYTEDCLRQNESQCSSTQFCNALKCCVCLE